MTYMFEVRQEDLDETTWEGETVKVTAREPFGRRVRLQFAKRELGDILQAMVEENVDRLNVRVHEHSVAGGAW